MVHEASLISTIATGQVAFASGLVVSKPKFSPVGEGRNQLFKPGFVADKELPM